MNRVEIEKLVRSSYDARRANDVEATLKHFHPEAEFRIVGSDSLKPMTEAITGHASLRQAFNELFPAWDWSDFHVQTMHIDGNTAFVYSSGTLRHQPSGKTMKTEILDRIALRDGLIVGFTEFIDTHLLTQVLGAGPA
jgi:ketosteroid isomerase-like protein